LRPYRTLDSDGHKAALANIPEIVGIAKPPQPMPACRHGAG